MAKDKDDFLSSHGMVSAQQFGAVMRASAVPASDFEGEYDAVGTYSSPAAKMLQRKAWESRMRQATGIKKEEDLNG
jgi:hypothetical protein